MGSMLLSTKEARRTLILERLVAGHLTIDEAARLLNLSRRHVIRLKGRIRDGGIAATAHGNRGRPPAHRASDANRAQVVQLATTLYLGASYAHLTDLLAEHHGLTLSPKTIGRILKAAAVPHAHTHRPAKRNKSRPRRHAEGELAQMDGSFHDWLEGRGPWMSLLGAIDDATGKVLALRFQPHEDTLGYLHLLDDIFERQGLPRGLYVDQHSIFRIPKHEPLTLDQQLAGQLAPRSQVGRACHELGIELILARTPQAKGRIERLWGTVQERLVIEMRIRGISDTEAANAFLPEFIERHNAAFAVAPALCEPVYLPKPAKHVLDRILSVQYWRKATGGSTLSFEGNHYQLVRPGSKEEIRPLTKGTGILVVRRRDGTLRAYLKGEGDSHRLVPLCNENPPQNLPVTPVQQSASETTIVTPSKPSKAHPWRNFTFGKGVTNSLSR